MHFNLIDILLIMINFIIPLVIIVGFIIFVVKKLNSIERKIDKLEKLVSEKGIKLDEQYFYFMSQW